MKLINAIKSKGFSPITAALVSILPHSICCGVPILLIALGLGGLSASSFLSQYHYFFTTVGILSLVYGVFVYWRNYHRRSCSCHSHCKTSQRCAFCLLFFAFALQAGMAAYFWTTANASPAEYENAETLSENQLLFQLDGLHCPGCAAQMEHEALQLEGIESVDVVFSKKMMTLETTSTDVNLERLVEKLESFGLCEVSPITSSMAPQEETIPQVD